MAVSKCQVSSSVYVPVFDLLLLRILWLCPRRNSTLSWGRAARARHVLFATFTHRWYGCRYYHVTSSEIFQILGITLSRYGSFFWLNLPRPMAITALSSNHATWLSFFDRIFGATAPGWALRSPAISQDLMIWKQGAWKIGCVLVDRLWCWQCPWCGRRAFVQSFFRREASCAILLWHLCFFLKSWPEHWSRCCGCKE